jgi:hypothetical protein
MFGLLLLWTCAGVSLMKVGIIIPGFDITDHDASNDWIPPWMDLGGDSPHGFFISSDDRSCFATGYDRSGCPSEMHAQAADFHAQHIVRTAKGCNLRPSPSTTNTPIRQLAAGDECYVNASSGDWLSVQCGGSRGWISKACL